MRLVYLMLAVALSGCGGGNQPPTSNTTSRQYWLGASPGFVYEFRLEDGTRCVAISRGGIACEWPTPSRGCMGGG